MKVEPTCITLLRRAPNWTPFLDEYAAESAIEGLPPPIFKFDAYRTLEKAGILHFFGATMSDGLVGLISVLVQPLPHYGPPLAVSESFFVAKAHRMTGAGLRLLKAAEEKARELGAAGLLVSAPFGGKLFEVLPRLGYRESHRVFFKQVDHG